MKSTIAFIISGVIFCAVTLSATSSSKWQITLRNRQFIPPSGIDADLRQTLQTATVFPIHGIVQLYKMASKDDRQSLRAYGVHLRQHLGGTAYLTEFSNKVSFATLTNNLVRWAGLLLPEDKTEKSLWQGKIEDWAKTQAGKVRVIAEFHPYVSEDEAQKILTKYTPTLHRFNYNFQWAIEIAPQNVKALAAEQSIEWLRQGPDGYRPLTL